GWWRNGFAHDVMVPSWRDQARGNSGSRDDRLTFPVNAIWVNSYDLSAKQDKIESAEKEISRLQAELNRLNAEKFSREEGILSYGEEQDLYQYEIRNFVVDTLEQQLKNSIKESRRYHILHDLIKTNKTEDVANRLREEIKSIFKSYVDMDAKTKSSLTKIGFDISEEGKHYKIIFHQDGRYTFSVSKTSSDSRAGKNLASDINKKIF
ncbi:hypothetical protein ACSZNG_23560, partial [Aeromonas hydrophila]